jgi:hypothetical protein
VPDLFVFPAIEETAAPHSSLPFMFWGVGFFDFPLMRLARLDAERTKLSDKLHELEIAERVLARFGGSCDHYRSTAPVDNSMRHRWPQRAQQSLSRSRSGS